MSFLTKVIQTENSFYTQQAAEADTGFGICPRYYDHYRSDLSAGYVTINKPVKGGQPEEPFTPDDVFGLTDVNGETILHQFLALEGMPIGYFIGAQLSNYKQELPNERKAGGHCQTSKAVLHLGNGESKTVLGRFPLQSSTGITYNFRKYNEDKDAPGVYAGKNFDTYGTASPEFAEKTGRPLQLKCSECLANNQDRYGEQSCKTSGEFAFFIYKVAFKGREGKLQWVTVKDLGIKSLGDGFVLVNKVAYPDLYSKPLVDLVAKINSHVPSSAVNANKYVTNLYQKQEPNSTLLIEFENTPFQTLAYPTQMFVAKLTDNVGKTSHCFLYSTSPLEQDLDLGARHAMLDKALTAYSDERSKTDKALEFYSEPSQPTTQLAAAIELTSEPSSVSADVKDLAARAAAGKLFGNIS